jgi:hypothetical protein
MKRSVFIHSSQANTMGGNKKQTHLKEINNFLDVCDVYRLPAKNRIPVLGLYQLLFCNESFQLFIFNTARVLT